jgi:hypothetical protein
VLKPIQSDVTFVDTLQYSPESHLESVEESSVCRVHKINTVFVGMASPRTRRVLQELKSDDENNRCFECKSHSIYICLECSGKHRGLGVHLSFVRSISMDKWKDS